MFNCSLQKLLYLAVVLVLTAGCASNNQSGISGGIARTQQPGNPSNQNPCERPSAIKGNITSISYLASGNFIGGLLLDGTREQNAAFDQVYVRVLNTAQVYKKQGKECPVVPFTSVKTGQRIQVQSTGIVMQSAPQQIDAIEIVIL